MDHELEKQITAALVEIKDFAKETYETAAAARNLASALSVALFEVAPEARETVERVLRATLQDATPSNQRATELALQIIGRPTA